MGHLGDFATGLAEEVLGEMAENFFGSRKRMDEMIERFANLAHELRKIQEDVVLKGGELMAFLPGVDGDELASALNLDFQTGLVLPCISHKPLPSLDKMPRGLTLGSRYAKVVLHLYEQYRLAVDGYMNGVTSAHPDEPRRKVVSLHREQLYSFVQRVNQSIEKMNEEMSASCIIRYASGFADPEMADKERVTGAHCPLPVDSCGCTDLDKDYAYHSIDFDAYGLSEYAPLPSVKEAGPGLKRLCSRLMQTEKATIAEAMAALKRSN